MVFDAPVEHLEVVDRRSAGGGRPWSATPRRRLGPRFRSGQRPSARVSDAVAGDQVVGSERSARSARRAPPPGPHPDRATGHAPPDDGRRGRRARSRPTWSTSAATPRPTPPSPTSSPAVQRAEIEGGRDACAAMIGRVPATFAYPFGDYDASTVELVRAAGFEAACTTDVGTVRRRTDVLTLPRLQVEDWSADRLAWELRGAVTARGDEGPADVDVSVVVVTYNHEPYIEQALASVVAQRTSRSFEILISEDCSTDGTRRIVEAFAAGEPACSPAAVAAQPAVQRGRRPRDPSARAGATSACWTATTYGRRRASSRRRRHCWTRTRRSPPGSTTP